MPDERPDPETVRIDVEVKCGAPDEPGIDGSKRATFCLSFRFPEMEKEEEVCVTLDGQKNKQAQADAAAKAKGAGEKPEKVLGDNTKELLEKLGAELKKIKDKIPEKYHEKINFWYTEVEVQPGRKPATGPGGMYGGAVGELPEKQKQYLGMIVLSGVDYYNVGTDYKKIAITCPAGGLSPRQPKHPGASKVPKGGYTGPDPNADFWKKIPWMMIHQKMTPIGYLTVIFDESFVRSTVLCPPPRIVPFEYKFDSVESQSREILARLVASGVECRVLDDFILPVADEYSGWPVHHFELCLPGDTLGIIDSFPWSMHLLPPVSSDFMHHEQRPRLGKPVFEVSSRLNAGGRPATHFPDMGGDNRRPRGPTSAKRLVSLREVSWSFVDIVNSGSELRAGFATSVWGSSLPSVPVETPTPAGSSQLSMPVETRSLPTTSQLGVNLPSTPGDS